MTTHRWILTAIAFTSCLFASEDGARRIRQLIATGKIEAARDEARKLVAARPDDVSNHGLLAESQMALKDFDGAEKSIQWMLDLRRADPYGLELAGRFRHATGDPAGAIEMFEAAYKRIPATNIEARARVAADYAEALRAAGQIEFAKAAAATALELVPGHEAALAVKEKLEANKPPIP